MKRILSGVMALLMLLPILTACMQEQVPADNSSPDTEESSTVAEGEMQEFYDPATADYDLTLFPISVPEKVGDSKNSKVLILSDLHYSDYYDGVGGYTSEERCELLIGYLKRTRMTYDCVIFNGDITSRDEELKREKNDPDHIKADMNYVELVKTEYFDQLAEKNIPYFVTNGNHDSCSGEEFERIFGYESNYVVLVGTTAYICIDAFSGERNSGEIATAADIPSDFVDEVEKLLLHDYVEQAFVVGHYMHNNFANTMRLCKLPKVVGSAVGHSHYNEIGSYAGKPMLQTGHFSRANAKMLTWGLGFSEFKPVAKDAPYVTDENGNQHRDYSETGSPWQIRVFRCKAQKTGTQFESYLIFPGMTYYECRIEGVAFAGFQQPYAESQPSFLGEDAPIDKSYYKKLLNPTE